MAPGRAAVRDRRLCGVGPTWAEDQIDPVVGCVVRAVGETPAAAVSINSVAALYPVSQRGQGLASHAGVSKVAIIG